MRRVLVRVRLLGGFAVEVDGRPVPAEAWPARQAASLVKLLALAPGARLHRDRVLDALWPDVAVDVGLPRLHKAAHYARRACGDRQAVVLKVEAVTFFPGATVEVDASEFEAAAARTLSASAVSPEGCSGVLERAGELLPDDLGEPWLDQPRERLRLRTVDLLRGAHQWERLLDLEPGDEEAHVELLREAVREGDRAKGLRRYVRMERALDAELGISPPPEALVLREQLFTAGSATSAAEDDVPRTPAHGWSTGATLLERDMELNEMVAAVASAIQDRHGVAVLVSGEAGAGKSSVVRAFLDRLGSAAEVHLGACDDLLTPRTLGPFRDMAVDHPELAQAFTTERPDEILPALLHAFVRRPSVVVVEDVHWADDATLDAIRFLARRVPGIAGALILTFRDSGSEYHEPLRRLLGGLVGSQVKRITLSPLSLEAVGRLGASSEADPVELHRVTQGNPFFVTEVLSARGTGVPATVRDAVLARLSALPPSVRTFVERLSVVPTRTERWLAEIVAEENADVIVAAERSGIIHGVDRSVAFRHELARQAIEGALTAGERLRANRIVVNALLGLPHVESSRLLHHAQQSGQIEVIREHGPAAALVAARLGAHRQAAELLRVVLEHRELLDPREVADLLTRRGYSLYLLNQYEAALTCAESGVVASEQVGDPILLADALQVLARVVLFAKGPMVSRLVAERAVEVLNETSDETRMALAWTELARAYSNLATVSIVADSDHRAESYAARALEIAQRLHRRDIEAQAMCYLGDARLGRGDPRGEADLARAISLAATDNSIEAKLRCFVNAAHGAYRSGRLHDAERFVAAGLEASADGDFFTVQYRLRLTWAAISASRGQWDEATAALRAMVEDPGDPGVMASLGRSMLGRLLARRGELDAASEVLAPALEQVANSEDSFLVGPVTVAQVELGWLDGSLGEITDAAQRALDLAANSGHRSVHAELSAYLCRAGIRVPGPPNPPGPWGPTIAGRWEEAAAAWSALGERYEQAVVLATAPEPRPNAQGVQMLEELGATATLQAV